MDKLLIRGGRQLRGEVRIFGVLFVVLLELCAALLTDEPVILENVPRLQDVATMVTLIRNMGVHVERDESRVRIDAADLHFPEAPYELVTTMRASVLALGPLLARFGEATVSLPGGCAIGARPVDQHIRCMEQMGAEIVVEHGYMIAKLPKGREPIAQPPGSETVASPKRASKGPSASTDARIVFTSSYGASGKLSLDESIC